VLDAGRLNDKKTALAQEVLPRGALRIADLGYFDLDDFAQLSQRNVYWLSRLQPKTAVFDAEDGRRLNLVSWLKDQEADLIDWPVELGVRQRLAARLVAIRVPEAVAEQRRQRLRKKAQKKGKKASAEQLALCAWTLLVTNLPVELVSVREMVVLSRCRWQIELLFKVWKSDGGLDKSRSGKPWRILSEVYAKLIALVIQHWISVAGCWEQTRKSLRKAAGVVREMGLALAGALWDRQRLEEQLAVIVRAMRAGIDCHHSQADPRTYQLLEDPQRHGFTFPKRSA
jgi:hypothetical protein